jgi:hypothetical protein
MVDQENLALALELEARVQVKKQAKTGARVVCHCRRHRLNHAHREQLVRRHHLMYAE